MNPWDIIELGMLVRRTTTRSTSTRMSNAGAVPTLAASIAVMKSFFISLPNALDQATASGKRR